MDEKDVFIGLRTTRMERHAVRAFALAQGLTVSELIRQRIVEQAVRPVRAAALAADGLPGETEKFWAPGELLIVIQILVGTLGKRTIDESVVHESLETPKPRLNPLILPSQ
jgi:hypothetical protein